MYGDGDTIGGTTAGARDVISGNEDYGLAISGSMDVVEGDYIGTDVTGTVGLGNGVAGVYIDATAGDNTIGGTTALARNVISGNVVGVEIAQSQDGYLPMDNVVEGNYIGTDVTGTVAVGNGTGVEISVDSTGNTIGGTTAGARNLISGNTQYGVEIQGAGSPTTSNNVVEGDYIGTDVTGTVAVGNGIGVLLAGATDNTIGGTTAGARNVISGNGYGVEIQDDFNNNGPTGNVVEGDYIGPDVTGTLVLGNSLGVYVQGDVGGTDTIGGTTAGARNVISGNQTGVFFSGSTDVVVEGDYIGTDVTGRVALIPMDGNAHVGVEIENNSSGITIGGSIAGARDVIFGNSIGVLFDIDPSTTSNVVEGDYIGTDFTGTVAVGNFDGVAVGSTDNTIGGSIAGAGDVISGNEQFNVAIDGTAATGNVVEGDYIGTDLTGAVAMDNSGDGIEIYLGATDNTIGGSAGAPNVISGNAGNGVEISGAGTTGNVVEGNNDIGTDNTGGTDGLSVPNNSNGVVIDDGATDNTIGGITTGPTNVISGNGGNGVEISGSGTTGNVVEGDNDIGTDSPNTSSLANQNDGVEIVDGASGNTIGGTASGAGNVIAYNRGNGVTVGDHDTDAAIDNAIRGNSIYGNSGIGIDLGDDGVTLNDSSGHSGPNLFQDFPVLSAAITSSGTTAISGSLAGADGTSYQLDFFSNPSADPSGYGQAQTFLMTATVTIGSTGTATFNVHTPSALAVGQFISATATDPAGNTSEFSADTVVTGQSLPPLVPDSIAAVTPNPRNTPVANVQVTFNEPVNLSTFTYSALTLNDNGGANLITSAVTASLVSGSTYQINGLTGLTSAEGNYTLTLSAADIQDQDGNAGSGTVKTSWLMDTTPPTSSVNALPAHTTSTSFLIKVTGSDPNGSNGSAPSGVSSFAIYDSEDNGAFTLWTTVTPGTPSATFTGQAGNAYGFYSIATDNAGNVQPTPTAAQATIEIVSPLSLSSIATVVPNPRNTDVSSIDVTFNEPVNLASFTYTALTLTDNGGSNLITNAVTASFVSGSTYQINGLAGLTGNNGDYKLTVNAADIQDQDGNPGSGTLAMSWLMDTTPPASHVNPLAARGTSLSFSVSVTGSDGGSPPSGVASYGIYSSTDGGPWTLWTSVTASSPSATFTGLSNTTYSFYSIAHDLAGNVESKSPLTEASTYLPALAAPVTAVDGATAASNPSSVNTSTGTFTLNLTGEDPGGAVLTYFEVFVSVDQGAYEEVGPYAIPAGGADSKGNYHSTVIYQGLTDGMTHTYSFYSIGLDAAGNLQGAPSSPNVKFQEQFGALSSSSGLQVTGFTVEHDSPSRSFVRYLDIAFNESDSQSSGALTSIVNSIGTSSPEILIYKYDLNGDASSKTAVPLSSPTVLDVVDHAIEIDFGKGGIGGSANTTAADGYYEVDIKLPDGQVAVHHFYRLLGDVDGDGIVDQNDLNEIAADINETSPIGWTPLSADVTGSGSVTTVELTIATRSKNHKLGAGLSLG